jgi:hypothetical protein
MNDLLDLYAQAGDVTIATEAFEARLAGLAGLNRLALLALAQRLDLIVSSRHSTELLRVRLRERIRNRRAAALRCQMLGL